MASGSSIAVGAIIGTGAAMVVSKVGFKPRLLLLVNVEDPCIGIHIDGMPDASVLIHTDGTTSWVTSQGITLTDVGFNMGTRADINTDGEQVFYAAVQ